MKKNKGFTLIELLAVIIILGILMIIAIPSVTRYISDSRKSTFVDSIKQIISGARNLANTGKLELFNSEATYYLPTSCITTENARRSPYGNFLDDNSFVVITYNGNGFNYYWIGIDETGHGISKLISYDELDEDDIESDLIKEDIKNNLPKDGKETIILFNSNCTDKETIDTFCDNKIIFDPNGGIISKNYKCYNDGDKFGLMPTPTKNGFVFDHWEDINGKTITPEDIYKDSYKKYEVKGDYVFDGSSYIDTGINLFSKEYANSNFYISFEIKENKSTESHATLINAKNEGNNKYPGFVFRRFETSSKYNISFNKTVNNNTESFKLNSIPYSIEKVEFFRINNEMYYRLDGGSINKIMDLDDYTEYFDIPVTIGASLNSSKQPFRYFKGTLSNIIITFLDDDATFDNYLDHFGFTKVLKAVYRIADIKVNFDANGGVVNPSYTTVIEGNTYGNLPIPTREGYIFDGWETNVLDVSDLTIKAINSGLAVNENGYVYDKSPDTDTRWANNGGAYNDSTWYLGLIPNKYRIEINYIHPSTLPGCDGAGWSCNPRFAISYGANQFVISPYDTFDLNSIIKEFVVDEARNYGIFLKLVDGIADVKLYEPITKDSKVRLTKEHTLKAKWIKKSFEYEDDYVFTGSNYIDTGMYIFSEKNINKNFYISFEIKENNSTAGNATLINAKNEGNNKYPGFVFRRNESNSKYYISLYKTVNGTSNIFKLGDIPYNIEKVEFFRINNEMYYRLDGGSINKIMDLDDYTEYFDIPVTIGASLNSSKQPFRYFKGTLSNIVVTYLDDNASLNDF